MSEKTEEPTPRRLRRARERGDSGASPFAAQTVAFFVAVALAPSAVKTLFVHTITHLQGAFVRIAEHQEAVSLDVETVSQAVLELTAPLFLAMALSGALAMLVQTGGFLSMNRISPKFRRLDLWDGIKGLFSSVRFFAVTRAFFAASIVTWLAYRLLRGQLVDLVNAQGQIGRLGLLAGGVAQKLALQAAIVGVVLGGIDWFVVRQAWRRKLRMSKDEVKREHRESEGDPQIRAARERAHREMLAAATIANVRDATVVVVNPTHVACALRYNEEEGDEAPVLVASGEGDLAARIVRAAHDFGIPVVRDVPLARALIELEVDDTIPEALYEAVAEILHDAAEIDG